MKCVCLDITRFSANKSINPDGYHWIVIEINRRLTQKTLRRLNDLGGARDERNL